MKDLQARSHVAEKVVRFISTQPYINRVLLLIAALLAFTILLLAVGRLSAHYSTVVPRQGGVVTEAVVGFPRIINPIYAENDAEHSVSALVYSGLVKIAEDGSIVPDLAETITREREGVYVVNIRTDAVFHDGTPVTAEDVVFTIEEVQDPANNSPLAPDWNGVEVELVDEHTVRFTLDSPYAFFSENLTVGIVPEHLWSETDIGTVRFLELGSLPIGSGPFKIESIDRHQSLGVAEMYTLIPFDEFIGGEPYIGELRLNFFENEDALLAALENGSIDAAPVSTPTAFSGENGGARGMAVETAPMPRSFGLFFNQNQNDIFIDTDVRRALSLAVDREALVDNIFSGYAEPLTGPLPAYFLERISLEAEPRTYDPDQAAELLADAGFARNEAGVLENGDGETLSFTISTVAIPELINTAEFLETSFESLGADITVEAYGIGVLSRDVIRTRDYETLLFGLAYNRSLDLYPFFHSSNIDDPGLNIAFYTNPDVDDVLEDLQAESDQDARVELIDSALEDIQSEQAALFLYSPIFTYAIDQKVKGVELPPVIEPHNRFSTVADWYIYTEQIFSIFDNDIRN